MMFCFIARKRLIPYIEGSLNPKAHKAMADHLAKCKSCADEMKLVSRACGAIRSAKTSVQEPATDLWSRIEREITPPTPVVHRKYSRGLYYAGAMAAAATILLVAVNIDRHGEVKTIARSVTNSAPGQSATKPPVRIAILPEESHTPELPVAKAPTAPSERMIRVEHRSPEPSRRTREPEQSVREPAEAVVAYKADDYQSSDTATGIPDAAAVETQRIATASKSMDSMTFGAPPKEDVALDNHLLGAPASAAASDIDNNDSTSNSVDLMNRADTNMHVAALFSYP